MVVTPSPCLGGGGESGDAQWSRTAREGAEPGHGDASACLKVTCPGGPARPADWTIKERARHRAR